MPDRKPPKYQLGEWILHAISDGLYRLDGGAMFGTVPKVMWEKVKPPDERNRIDMCLSCLLAVRGNEKILIEAGIGDKNTDKFEFIYGVDHISSIDEELARLDLTADDIDHVILSHLHFDHSGSLTFLNDEKEPIPHFPNAKHHVHAIEWDTALNPNPRNRASYIQNDWMPIHNAGLMEIHGGPASHLPGDDPEIEIVPGIKMMNVGGHTPGQCYIRIDSSESREVAIFVGDLIPTGAHMPVPWIMGYDLEPVKQVELKEELLSRWMDENALVIFPHETRYPWAHIVRDERDQFMAIPIDEGWLEPLRTVQWPDLPLKHV